MGEGTYISHVTEEEGEAETESFVQHDLCSLSLLPLLTSLLLSWTWSTAQFPLICLRSRVFAVLSMDSGHQPGPPVGLQ